MTRFSKRRATMIMATRAMVLTTAASKKRAAELTTTTNNDEDGKIGNNITNDHKKTNDNDTWPDHRYCMFFLRFRIPV